MAKTSNSSDKFIVRLPDGMRERLKDQAAKNNRTLNAEIVDRLETTLQQEDRPPITPEIFDRLFSRLDDLSDDIKKSKKD